MFNLSEQNLTSFGVTDLGCLYSKELKMLHTKKEAKLKRRLELVSRWETVKNFQDAFVPSQGQFCRMGRLTQKTSFLNRGSRVGWGWRDEGGVHGRKRSIVLSVSTVVFHPLSGSADFFCFFFLPILPSFSRNHCSVFAEAVVTLWRVGRWVS